MAVINSSCVEELSEYVEKLTHTGQKTLDPIMLKKLKGICRLSDKYVEHAYHLITHQLNKEHSEIRYSAFQILNELFRRSHCFRELVIADLRHIMNMTAETSHKHPLPLPRSVALDLKRLALKTMQEWNNEFGPAYKKLQIGFNFLQVCKKVDFNALNNESLAEQARIHERERRQNLVNEERLKKVNAEIAELEPEINNTVTALQNCISLLLPTLEEFFITDNDNDDGTRCTEDVNMPSTSRGTGNITDGNDSEDSESDSGTMNLREYGMINRQQTIQVTLNSNIPKIKESAANKVIIENARDLFKLINGRYYSSVKKWIAILTKSSGAANVLKKIMDLKQLLETALNKFKQLKLLETSEDTTSESDSDFEEVQEKDGYEESVKEDLLANLVENPCHAAGFLIKESKPAWSIWSQENNDKDPTTPQCTLTSQLHKSSNSTKKLTHATATVVKDTVDEQIPSTSTDPQDTRKTKLLAVAPKLPFDVDLYHWEDEKVPTPTMVAVFNEGHQFWSARPADGMEEIPVPDGSATLRTRVIEYTGQFQPVKWSCRAPLGSGKLCPRRDRVKCPFHGPIVPRDETGQCSKPEDAERFQRLAEEKKIETPDWQDPQLLEEIKAATGLDLKMPEKRKRGKKKTKKKVPVKYPGLTDIKAKQNTPHSRLSKKVFNKTTMKRISAALDNADHKRFRDKYGDQFHYMHNTV